MILSAYSFAFADAEAMLLPFRSIWLPTPTVFSPYIHTVLPEYTSEDPPSSMPNICVWQVVPPLSEHAVVSCVSIQP